MISARSMYLKVSRALPAAASAALAAAVTSTPPCHNCVLSVLVWDVLSVLVLSVQVLGVLVLSVLMLSALFYTQCHAHTPQSSPTAQTHTRLQFPTCTPTAGRIVV